MNTSNSMSPGLRSVRQRGAVLFFALIALVVMTLAAVALIRSVDTNTLIAGNLAFKQSATSSGDVGTELAINWLLGNAAALNTSNAAAGYYNSLNQALDATVKDWNWAAISALAGQDSAGNTVRYVIQRLCNHPPAQAASINSGATILVSETNCILSDAPPSNSGKDVLDATQACSTCQTTDGAPVYRITAQVTGPRNTVSYVQAFVF